MTKTPSVDDIHAMELALTRDAEAIARRAAEDVPALTPEDAAAHLVGVKPNEVVSVEHRKEGLAIATTDGVILLVVSPDRPDAAGHSGVMFAPDSPKMV